jgi:hypothetical protein
VTLVSPRHSTTRALYATYNGPLYQVLRQSDGETLNIGGIGSGGTILMVLKSGAHNFHSSVWEFNRKPTTPIVISIPVFKSTDIQSCLMPD